MFAQFRIFAISGFTSGKPTIAAAIPFLTKTASEDEVNNVSVTLSPEQTTKTYKADNKVEKDTVVTGYNGTVTFYGIDKTALAAISKNTTDTNGNTALESSPDGNPKVVIFFQGKNAKGKKYNMWLYNVEFDNVPFAAEQEENDPKATSLNFFASSVIYQGHNCFGTIVYEGSTGYVEEGTEPVANDLYMPVYTQSGSNQG